MSALGYACRKLGRFPTIFVKAICRFFRRGYWLRGRRLVAERPKTSGAKENVERALVGLARGIKRLRIFGGTRRLARSSIILPESGMYPEPLHMNVTDEPSADPPAPIKVFVVEDHGRLRELISVYLGMQRDMELCGSAASGEEAIEAIRKCRPDYALVDLSLPGISGIEVIERITRDLPDVRCLVLSAHSEGEFARRAFDAGARGYVLKGQPDEVAEAIRMASGDRVFVSEEIQSVL